MSVASSGSCSTCEAGGDSSYPFCPECGRLSPSFVRRGSFAVEIGEIPARRLRSDVAARIRSWFPAVDVLEAENRLKSGRTLLLAGVDEESGIRVLDALKNMKVPGKLVRADAGPSWLSRLWNPGLVATSAAVLIAVFVGGIAGFLAALAGLAVPAVWAFAGGRTRSPLVSGVPGEPEEDLVRLSSEYSIVMKSLSDQDGKTLRELTAAVSEVRQRLRLDSLASVAAGGETGRLFTSLSGAIRSAVDISRRIPSASEDQKSALREELRSLNDSVTKADSWFRSIEGRGAKPADALSEELGDITASIDRILDDVRPHHAESGRARGKTLTR
ncbi:MAG: hypothetical protein V1792_03775 [Pseudomonadota bacterium]